MREETKNALLSCGKTILTALVSCVTTLITILCNGGF